MNSADHADAHVAGNVSILSVADCPAIETHPVQVLCRRDGAEARQVINMQRPTRFDQLMTVLVEETSAAPHAAPIPIRSGKDALRWTYRHARDLSARYGAPTRFDRPVLDTRHIEPNNFAHLLHNIIPLCLEARKTAGPDVAFVLKKLDRGLETKIRELLSQFAIDPVVTDKTIKGPIVHIRGSRGFAVYDLPAFDCEVINFFPKVYDQYAVKKTIAFDKVFLSRRGARALVNHAEVERILNAHGYKTIYMEDHSIQDQISIGANSRHVVAIHGAAMAYLTFAKRIESVIELLPPHVYHEYFPVALGANVGNYVLVIQDLDPRVAHSGWETIYRFKNQPFAANIALLEQALALAERPHTAS